MNFIYKEIALNEYYVIKVVRYNTITLYVQLAGYKISNVKW